MKRRHSPSDATVRVAILGCGNIGGELAVQLQRNRTARLLARSHGSRYGRPTPPAGQVLGLAEAAALEATTAAAMAPATIAATLAAATPASTRATTSARALRSSSFPNVDLCAVLVRRANVPRVVDRSLLCETFDDMLATKPHIVVECMGGTSAPAHLCERFLDAGIHVVSANKSMLAESLAALNAAARRSGAYLRFDAAVCAGVPVLESVARLRPAGIEALHGIVNGTCNYILHAMETRRISQAEAIAEAISRGYAEPDPTADVSGQDSAQKLCLLAAAAGAHVPSPQEVDTIGIEAIDGAAIDDVRALGVSVRLVAHWGTGLHVAPTLVNRRSTLAAATGTQNVVSIETSLAGTVGLTGPGAGARPTVAALMADIEACALGTRGWAEEPLGLRVPEDARADPRSRWLLRITGAPTAHAAAVTDHATLARASIIDLALGQHRALLHVGASRQEREQLVTSLRTAGAHVQVFSIASDVALSF